MSDATGGPSGAAAGPSAGLVAPGTAGHCLHTGTGRVHAGQVVPRAVGAHLDHVADHRFLAPPVPGELGLGGHAPPTRGQARTEDEGDVDQVGLLADGALLADGTAQVAGGPQQLGVGIADIEPGQAALPVLADDRVAGEKVLAASPGRGGLHALDPSGSQAHPARVPPGPADQKVRRPGAAQRGPSVRRPGRTPRCRYLTERCVALIYRTDISYMACRW